MKRRERLTPEQVEGMLAWAHSGFSVHNADCADPTSPEEMMRLARYLLHPPIALERLEYRGKNKPLRYCGRRPDHRTGATWREFDPLELLADLCLHIPPPRAHLTRLYGAYSTRHRVEQARLRESSSHTVAVRNKKDADQTTLPHSPALRERKANWARLISKVFEVDPHRCPCGGTRRFISVIIDPAAVRKILKHVRKIEARAHAPPPAC